MAATWMPIEQYLVYHYGWKSGGGAGEVCASIICYRQLENVGYINFYLPGHVPESTVETSSSQPPRTYLIVNFEITRIDEILGTLRQEQPLLIGVTPDQYIGWVATGVEPVGEQEQLQAPRLPRVSL